MSKKSKKRGVMKNSNQPHSNEENLNKTFKVKSHIKSVVSKLQNEIDVLKQYEDYSDDFYYIDLGVNVKIDKGDEVETRRVQWSPETKEIEKFGLEKWLKVKEKFKKENYSVENIITKELEKIEL